MIAALTAVNDDACSLSSPNSHSIAMLFPLWLSKRALTNFFPDLLIGPSKSGIATNSLMWKPCRFLSNRKHSLQNNLTKSLHLGLDISIKYLACEALPKIKLSHQAVEIGHYVYGKFWRSRNSCIV